MVNHIGCPVNVVEENESNLGTVTDDDNNNFYNNNNNNNK